jgi:hypothetical protein
MGVANRVQLALCRETTLGTTPGTPRMRALRFTKEALSFTPNYVDSDEIRSDRMLGDPIKVMQASEGSVDFELSFPDDNSPLSEILRSAFYNTWSNSNYRDNDGTADSVITDVATTNTVLTVTTGTALVANELYKFSGFAVAGNNGRFKCTTGSATVPRFVGSGITNETAPPAAARVKCIGIEGDSGDITAAASGIASTTLDFTTIPGLVAGKWIKIDSTTSGNGFATAALNTWIRITTVAAHLLTCDNLPAAWTTDNGSGKSIRIYFGDQLKNGTTQTSLSIEKGFLDQTVPTYIVNTGMVANNLSLSVSSRNKITGSVSFTGMGGSQSTTTLDASPDAATTGQVMAANADVGRIAEAGSTLTSPNWCRDLSIQINNNQRTVEAADSASPVSVNPGECTVTGKVSTYFGDNSLLTKLYAGTASSINARVSKNNQALVIAIPRETLRSGVPSAQGKNTDVMLESDFQASIDTTTTNAQILLDRFEYVA